MRTIDAKLSIPSESPRMLCEYLSTVAPIVGEVKPYPYGLIPKLQEARGIWRMRCAELARHEWAQISTSKLVFAHNCPVCCVHVDPWTTTCNLIICPWCFSRRVSSIYTKVSDLVRRRKATLVTYRHTCTEHRDIYFDADGGLTTSLDEVFMTERWFPKQFRDKYMKDALGGFYWYTLSPLVYKATAKDGSCGRWLRMHSCVAVMPAGWNADLGDSFRVVKRPRDFTIAKLIGGIFKYPPGWLRSDPAVMATFLNSIRCKRFRLPFGYFKRVKSNSC